MPRSTADAELEAAVGLVRSQLRAEQEARKIPGLSAAVVHGQATLWSGGFGLADPAAGRPAGADTVYRMASVTKLFTTTAVMLLRDAGQLQLDDPAAPGGLLATSPEDAVLRAEQRGRLGRGLGALGEREREIVGRRFGAGLRHREIARVVGTTEGNAAKILHRALRKLRDVIDDDEEAPR